MKTILGKLRDTEKYIGKPGYNVFPRSSEWTRETGQRWLDEAIARGDEFIMVSTEMTGEFAEEVKYLRKLGVEILYGS